MSKRLGKYVAFCDFDKSLIVLSATSGSISIASFATVIGTPVGIASASLSLTFSIFIGISQEDFMEIINEEKNYRELKESIRMMSSQRSDFEKINLIKEGKRMGINEVIKRNDVINNNLKYQI